MTSLDSLLSDPDFREFIRSALEAVEGKEQKIEPAQITDASGQKAYQVGTVDSWTLDITLREALQLDNPPPIGSESGERLRIDIMIGGIYPYGWVGELVGAFFDEIRNIICEKNELERVAKTAEFSAKGTALALATWLGQNLGFSAPFALAGAAVIILILADATRGAFCKMTKRQTLDKIGPDTR
jgi:hypothetical protein